jgi:hypothetical protein
VITNEAQYSSTKAHLARFDEAASNIEARLCKRTRVEQLELDAVRSKAEDLRVELSEFDGR